MIYSGTSVQAISARPLVVWIRMVDSCVLTEIILGMQARLPQLSMDPPGSTQTTCCLENRCRSATHQNVVTSTPLYELGLVLKHK